MKITLSLIMLLPVFVFGQTAEQYFASGNTKKAAKDYPGAIADYSKAIQINPKYTVAYYFRAFARFHGFDYKGAIADYSKVLELEPKDNWAYGLRGKARFYLKDYTGTIEDCSKEIKLNSMDAESFYYRGFAKISLGQKDAGCLDIREAKELLFDDADEVLKAYCNH